MDQLRARTIAQNCFVVGVTGLLIGWIAEARVGPEPGQGGTPAAVGVYLELGLHWLEIWVVVATAVIIWWTAAESRAVRMLQEQQLADGRMAFLDRGRAEVRPALALFFRGGALRVQNVGRGAALDLFLRTGVKCFPDVLGGLSFRLVSHGVDFVREVDEEPTILRLETTDRDGASLRLTPEAARASSLEPENWSGIPFMPSYRDIRGEWISAVYQLAGEGPRFNLDRSGYGIWLDPDAVPEALED